MNKVYLPQNIKYLRKQAGISQQALADKIDVPRSTLNNWERGSSEPRLEVILKIAQYFEVAAGDMISTRMEYLQEEDYTEDVKILAVTLDEMNRSNIELVDSKAEAGYLESFNDPEYIKDLPRISFPNLPHGNYRGFEINGDSMLPIEPGSIIICKYVERLDKVNDGETYIVAGKDGLVYKRLYKDDENKCLLMTSDNPIYQPYELDYEDVREIWSYYAHLSFSDGKEIMEVMMDDKLEDMNEKIEKIYNYIIKEEENESESDNA